jgi:D-lactate dehydrogenase
MSAKKQAGQRIAAQLSSIIPADRLKTDPLYTFAYSGDASYFRLVPALVVIVTSEEEVRATIAAAHAEGLPVTFRAAGTSLSGQATTDGVLVVLGDGWRKLEILEDGDKVILGPGVIVANANLALRKHDRKIGPDPASQASCKIGGVVANNSSGMCCGVVQNTYHTMHRLRLILNDGTLLDSGDQASRDAFKLKRPDLIEGLEELAAEVRRDNQLVDLIRRKYQIKNTVGYSLNALVDFTDPIDILTHLMVGSEGTLGFVSEITYNTVPDHPHKATALVPFATNHKAAQGVEALHHVGVSAAEFMERKALATVEDQPAMQPFLHLLNDTSPAVLIEIMAESDEALDKEIEKANAAMQKVGTLGTPQFTKDPVQQEGLWDVRKGLFASAGGTRPKGTVMLTEDVAVPIHRLADAVDDLRKLLDQHGYYNGIIFGHTLAGNLHFQMDANFSNPAEVERFDAFSRDLAQFVSLDYQGSLKAEHGTGRAIAPFVEQEWGSRAYGVMRKIKNLFDAENQFNPGVLLNDDENVHIKDTKNMAITDDLVDMCIECGFCESTCPSAGLTLTPRQRIVVARETARLEQAGGAPDLIAALEDSFVHAGMETCAACNLCSTKCPVGIETGTMIMAERRKKRSGTANKIAQFTAAHTGTVENIMRTGVAAQKMARSVVGDGVIDSLAGGLNAFSGHRIPKPNRTLSPGPGIPKHIPANEDAPNGKVLYFPACASRMFGAPKTSYDLLPVTEAMLELIKRAGFDPVLPQSLSGECCGQPFASKGFPEEAKKLGAKLQTTLETARGGQTMPMVTDMSTCALHAQHDGIELTDSAEFLLAEIVPRLTITQKLPVIAVHHNCSAQRMKEQPVTEAVAAACASEIAVLKSITCCGYAGDKGMYQPQLNAHALRFAKNDVPANCTIGVSTVSTCATGLSEHLDIPFVGLASILEYVSRTGHQ